MFNQDDPNKIVSDFKNHINTDEALTGNDFCKLLGISKEKIQQIRNNACKDNLIFFIQELLNIKEIREIIENNL